MMNAIKCRFLDANGEPRGREYTYYADFDVQQGQYVEVPKPRVKPEDEKQTKRVLCTAVGVPEEEIEPIRELIKKAVCVSEDQDEEKE